MSDTHVTKPRCKLSKTDGNIFSLLGRVTACLKKAGLPEQAQEVSTKLMQCASYHEALALLGQYVDVY